MITWKRTHLHEREIRTRQLEGKPGGYRGLGAKSRVFQEGWRDSPCPMLLRDVSAVLPGFSGTGPTWIAPRADVGRAVGLCALAEQNCREEVRDGLRTETRIRTRILGKVEGKTVQRGLQDSRGDAWKQQKASSRATSCRARMGKDKRSK